jgi:hypothetical protein
MDKAGPTKARPAANIGMAAAENPVKCSHSKRRVILAGLPSDRRPNRRSRFVSSKIQFIQRDRWLSNGEKNRPDMKQIGSKTLRFEFA